MLGGKWTFSIDWAMQDRIDKARVRLMELLPLERIRQIPKYRNFKKAQYLELINKLENLSVLLLKSYIFAQKQQT